MKKKDVVAKTIQTYEKLAEEYYRTHFDIYEIKPLADYFISNLTGLEVLDVGCGPGRDSKYFSEHGLTVTGIDLTDKFIHMASQNVPAAKFILMDMRQLDFPADSFAGIWACASFLHLPKKDAPATLLGFKNVLKTGGLLYFSVKQGEGEKFVAKEEYRGQTKFFAFYTLLELQKLFAATGLEIIQTSQDVKKNNTWINIFARKQN